MMNEQIEQKSLTKQQKDLVFEKQFFSYADALYNFAFRLTIDEDDANDLVQDTLMKAYRFFDYFEQGTNAKAWLFRILKNSFINEYRKKSKQPTRVDYNDVEDVYNSDDTEQVHTIDLRQETVKNVMGDEVVIAVNTLPIEFRTVILLCDVEGFTYEEMSKILDIPIGTVRSRLHRARNELKGRLMGYAKKMGYNID